MKNRLLVPSFTTAALLVSSASLATGWNPERPRKELAEARRAVVDFQREPDLGPYFRDAWGYAVFPTIGKAAFVFGGAHGTGKAFERSKVVGNVKISKATIGLQIGGEVYSEIVFFRDRNAFEKLKKGEATLHADASAAVATAGANVESAWDDGVAVFARSKGGLIASAAVGAQSLRFKPIP